MVGGKYTCPVLAPKLRTARADTRIDQSSIHISYSPTGTPNIEFYRVRRHETAGDYAIMSTFLHKTEQQIQDAVRDIAKDTLGLTNFRPQGVLSGIVETVVRLTVWVYNALALALPHITKRI